MQQHRTREDARKALFTAGYTKFIEYSSCGDSGHGSREYWMKPDAPLNQFGYPKDRASISLLGDVWGR